jgi:rubrerythrin
MSLKTMIGDNRTGTARAPARTEEMIGGNVEFAPPPVIDDGPITAVRVAYATESQPLGTVPPPASAKQVAKSVVGAVKGGSPNVFVDKLGARLAFERNGVRLYQALLSKFDAFGSFDGGPSRAELLEILGEEEKHFALLTQAMERLGADPTAMTPAADVEAVLTMGVQAVMVDARMNLRQSLEAALVAELTDNDAWESLIALADAAGEKELTSAFRGALAEEQKHLTWVRRWMAADIEAA